MSGLDCQFTEEPPKCLQCYCPICLLILREPYQVTCCGKSYCKDCIQKMKAKKSSCPTCNTVNFEYYPNLGLQQPLYGFRVSCSNKEEGCGWQGELGQLDQHLNVDPEKDKQFVGCAYSGVGCLFCHVDYQRSQLEDHQNINCRKRPYSCLMCDDYRSTFEDVTTNHAPACKCRRVECPKSCGASNLQHQHLQEHVSSQCPLTLVECEFSDAGCDAKVYRKDLPSHLSDNLIKHMSLLARESKRQKLQIEKDQKRIAALKIFVEKSIQRDIVLEYKYAKKRGKIYSSRIPIYSNCEGYKFDCTLVFIGSVGAVGYVFRKSEFEVKEGGRLHISAQIVDQRQNTNAIELKHDLTYDSGNIGKVTHKYAFSGFNARTHIKDEKIILRIKQVIVD